MRLHERQPYPTLNATIRVIEIDGEPSVRKPPKPHDCNGLGQHESCTVLDSVSLACTPLPY